VLTYRSILARLFFTAVACLLLCGIVSAEIPELLSLTDDTSNDFTIRKAGSAECAATLSAAGHESVPMNPMNMMNMMEFECGGHTLCADSLWGAEAISAELFILHSVLRR
jgi:hypothetical protein